MAKFSTELKKKPIPGPFLAHFPHLLGKNIFIKKSGHRTLHHKGQHADSQKKLMIQSQEQKDRRMGRP